MAKIPFDIKFRPQIESGEYKVETDNGYPVTIYRWDFKDKVNTPIMGSYIFEDGTEYCAGWSNKGCFSLYGESDNLDLFIVTPEPELTEWEKYISACLQKHGLLDCGAADRIAQNCAAELFELANKELKKHEFAIFTREEFDAEIEEAKAEALKEFDEKYKQSWFNEGKIAGRYEGQTEDEKYQQGVHDGKEEALKDLPGWRHSICVTRIPHALIKTWDRAYRIGSVVEPGDKYITLGMLEKLPGFKED